MKRRILSLIATLFLTLGVALSGCSNTTTSSSSSSNTTTTTTTSNHEHTYSSSYEYDDTYHWHPSICGHDVRSGEEKHTFTSTITDPTYEQGGYTTYTCPTCGYSYIDNETNALPITITWKNYDGSILEVDNNVPYGNIPSYDGNTPIKESDDRYNYTFAGWTPEVEPVSKDATYTAVFTSEEITYTIDFDLNSGTSSSYKGPIEVTTFSKDIFFFDCVKEDWQFRGWEYSGEKIFDEKGNQLKNVTLVDNMIFKAIYSQTVKLTITTNTPEAGTITGEGEYPYNSYVDVSVAPNQGYKFVGWYYQDTLLSSVENYKYMMWDIDVILEARFEKKDFNLRIYTSNEDYGLVLLKSNSAIDDYLPEYTSLKKYGSEVTIAAYSKSDIRFLGWYDENNVLVTTNAFYTFVMPNYDYNLEAKWNHFTINYNLNGGTNNPNNPDYYTIEDGNIHLQDPVKDGYSFLGWKCNDEIIDSIDVNILQNITLEAVWNDYGYKIYNDDNGKYAVIIGYNDSITDVIIPESISFENQIVPVKKIDEEAFKDNLKIRSIAIPSSVTAIGDRAFYNCSNLTTVTIGENSQLISIGSAAFRYCSSLTSIYIPNIVSIIGAYAFNICSRLTIYCEVDQKQEGWSNYWNNSNRPVVWNCISFEITDEGLHFVAVLDENDQKYVTIVAYTGSLTNVVIPSSININGEYIFVKTISKDAFYDNDTITTVTIPNSVTEIGDSAFYNCSNLTTVTIGENSQLISIGSAAFRYCSSLTSIYIPNSVASIEFYAFKDCSILTICCETSSQPDGWDNYWNDSNRPVIWSSYKGIYGNSDGLSYIAYQDSEGNPYIAIRGYYGLDADVVIPEYIDVNGEKIVVKKINDRAFYDNDTITTVTIPNSVTSIGNYAFGSCSDLTTVIISENSQLSTIGYFAFYGCSSLTSIYIPSSVTTIGESAFESCSNITIYCRASSKPSGWSSTWNYYQPVVWNCTYDEYLAEIA